MISLDSSLIAAIIIFLSLTVALNHLLFRPLLRVQAEREGRTSGLVTRVEKDLSHHLALFEQYQAAIKNGRAEGFRLQEQVRSRAAQKRAELLDQARRQAEQMTQESRASIQAQLQEAKWQLTQEARDIAGGIASLILRRPA
jgi:F-type H+-transporting ATPase subunit b